MSSFPTEAIATMLANAPLADTLGSSDLLMVLQDGLIKRLPTNAIALLATLPTVEINEAVFDATISNQGMLVNRSPAAPTIINLVSTPGIGRKVLVADMAGNCDGTNTITIGNATINGISGKTLNSAYAYCWLLSTGVGNNWIIVT